MDVGRLSPAERRVLDHVLAGRSARDIADQPVLSEATVRSHLSRIYAKLEVSGQIALLARAVAAPVAEVRPPAAATVPGHVQASRAPLATLLVGLVVLSLLVPFVSIVVGPGLLVSAWFVGRRPDAAALRSWRPWLLVAGLLISTWALLVIGLMSLGVSTGAGAS